MRLVVVVVMGTSRTSLVLVVAVDLLATQVHPVPMKRASSPLDLLLPRVGRGPIPIPGPVPIPQLQVL